MRHQTLLKFHIFDGISDLRMNLFWHNVKTLDCCYANQNNEASLFFRISDFEKIPSLIFWWHKLWQKQNYAHLFFKNKNNGTRYSRNSTSSHFFNCLRFAGLT